MTFKGSMMMMAGAVFASLSLFAAPAHAACKTDKALDDITYDDAQAIYECLSDKMVKGYKKKSKRWIPAEIVSDYRSWKLASSAPANPGFHSERFLMTWVNETGFDAYTDYAEGDNVTVPEGTVLVKESFSISKKGVGKPGPLFIMQKVKEGSSPKTMDWHYMMVMPNGTPAAVNVYQACNVCHVENFGFQGGMGYPVEEVRVSK